MLTRLGQNSEPKAKPKPVPLDIITLRKVFWGHSYEKVLAEGGVYQSNPSESAVLRVVAELARQLREVCIVKP